MNDRAKIALIYITFLIFSIPVIVGFILSGIVGGFKQAIDKLKPKETTYELWEQFKEGELNE